MSSHGNGVRRILNRDKVRMSGAGVMVGHPSASETAEPVVSLKRDAVTGHIQQIEVTCGCGEVVIIDCQYDGAQPA